MNVNIVIYKSFFNNDFSKIILKSIFNEMFLSTLENDNAYKKFKKIW